jgi:uncharacterized protein (DUF1800 family)
VLGRFEEMVLASARHPAMLLYLDNAQSIGPSSPAARRAARAGRPRGLNENYARELLELHTVGVAGGYTQDDVLALARILTGWTVSGLDPRRRGAAGAGGEKGFVFEDALHEPGEKTVLGVSYSPGGQAEGETVIRDLCRRPETATFVAGKLVRHFVADDPPGDAVEEIAATYRRTRGDLREVARTLVRLPAAWEDDRRKFRTPQDWLVAALRALEIREAPRQLDAALRQLRHPLWAPSAPKGYGDTRQDWLEPDALMNRAELARTITRIARSLPDPARLLDVIEASSSPGLPGLLFDAGVAADERVALALASPAFQWR